MDPDLKKEIIKGVITIIVTVIVTWIGQAPAKDTIYSWLRHRDNLPNVMGDWRAEWKYEDGSPLPPDTVSFVKWTKKSQFEGHGAINYPNKQYKYSITGEISPTRVVALTYKAESYPNEANIGTACLLLSTDSEDLVGTWTGYQGVKQPDGAEVFKLIGGKVTMHRLR
jgi:hypothetical protein